MRRQIRRFLTPPVFNDPSKTRTARWLHYALLILMLLLFVITVPIPFSGLSPVLRREFLISQSLLLIVLFFSYLMMRRGFVWSVATLTVVAILLGTVYSHLFIFSTINDLSVIGYFVLIPLTGLLFGRRSMWFAVAVSAGMLVMGFYFEIHGIIEQNLRPEAAFVDLVFLLTCLGLNTALALAILTEAEESAQLVQKSAADLVKTNSELQTSQEALQRASDELELRVIERTDELNHANMQLTLEIAERISTEETLRVAKEEAEAATEAKSAFLANMSHEIRTPMNGVIAMTSLLMEANLTEDQREYAQVIRRSSDALLTVINDILDFSRIESGKWVLASEPFELRICVADAVNLMASRAAEKRLELAFFVDFDVPRTLIGDATRVRQILVNLIANAVKFTEEGEVFTRVTAMHNGDRSYTVRFEIQDTGIGIKEEDLQQLFHSFSQVDVSNTRRHGGTGLGLAISQGLAKLMGGEVWVTSTAGVGSIFHFSINVDAISDKTILPPEPENVMPNRRVLLISENETNLEILSSYMSRWGHTFQASSSGRDPISGAESMDIAILDLAGEAEDIVNAIGRLRAGAPALPIIFLISLNANELRNRLADYDSLTTIHKPIKPSALFDALQDHLGVAGLLSDDGSAIQVMNDSLALTESMRILLVEDNVINQRVAAHVLRHLGLQSDLVEDGMEAVAAIRVHNYDIVFMDIQMPRMDGIEATHLIRLDQDLAHQPYIIALTAAAMLEERERCIEAGMDDFVAKPIRLDGIREVIKRYHQSKG